MVLWNNGKTCSYQLDDKAREQLAFVQDALGLPKDLFVGKSWDIQYNRLCHMALALAQ